MTNLLVEATSKSFFLHADITAPWDPTTDVIEGSLLPLDGPAPQESDWKTASWTPGLPATARLEYGEDGATGQLSPGPYWLRFRLHDNPEEPVLRAGVVILT